MDSPLELAKEKLDIAALWTLRGWPHKPAPPGKECFRPYAPDDRRPHGGIVPSGKKFHDFKTGETFDAPALLGRMENLNKTDAAKRFIELAGVKVEREGRKKRPRRDVRPAIPLPAPRPPETETRAKPALPELREPEPEELDVIGETRHVTSRGPELAAQRGMLFVCRYGGQDCWAVTDPARWNCQFRRMDGQPFMGHDGVERKTLGIREGWAAWPFGITEIGRKPNVILVEGTGDFIAAHAFIYQEGVQDQTAVVCMTGASHRIPSELLHYFKGKRVRIFPHIDTSKAGEHAGLRWETQIKSAGAEQVHCFDLSGLLRTNGEEVEDLNDVALMPHEEKQLLGKLMDY